jgi:hypothetical protein
MNGPPCSSVRVRSRSSCAASGPLVDRRNPCTAEKFQRGGRLTKLTIDGLVKPLGDNKTNDSFNAGVAKQNWGMIRICHPAYNNLRQQDFMTATALNGDRRLDAQVYAECRAYYGDRWWAGHRNGAAGLQNPNTADIQRFRAGYDWTRNSLNGHLCDNTRFWVDIVAILP